MLVLIGVLHIEWVPKVTEDSSVSFFSKSGILKLGRGEMKDLYLYKRILDILCTFGPEGVT